MLFNGHSDLQGQHALLSASKGHWIGYEPEKLRLTVQNHKQAVRGSRLHELAKEAIELGVKLAGNRSTISQYVNDAIGFRMSPEVLLFLSYYIFGTADAVGYREETNRETGELEMVLRIHDLKTGVTKTSFVQLRIYAALFCLEYKKDPFEMVIILRIYQNNEFKEEYADPTEIQRIMDKAVDSNDIVTKMLEGEE